jgi:hypothetical protein
MVIEKLPVSAPIVQRRGPGPRKDLVQVITHMGKVSPDYTKVKFASIPEAKSMAQRIRSTLDLNGFSKEEYEVRRIRESVYSRFLCNRCLKQDSGGRFIVVERGK